MTALDTLAAAMTEAQLQNAVIDLAHTYGWLAMHTRPARTDSGWRTPIQGDRGYPDLTLARDGRVVFAELKSQTGKVTAEQRAWLATLGDDAYLWRPEHWLNGEIRRVLLTRRPWPTTVEVNP